MQVFYVMNRYEEARRAFHLGLQQNPKNQELLQVFILLCFVLFDFILFYDFFFIFKDHQLFFFSFNFFFSNRPSKPWTAMKSEKK